MKYIPALDGLRAVAIVPVLVFHTLPDVLKGGFTGVDVFFVISGYLITSVVLHDIRENDFSMREFYLRRVLRLLPNALCMLSATVVATYLLYTPQAAGQTAEHAVWTVCNLSNVFIWRSVGGYWGEKATSLPLLHTWSLAVEEQFYLVFPVALWFLSRFRKPSILVMTSCVGVFSFALSVYGSWNHAAATFYLLPTRAWELLLGTALAAYQIPTTPNKQHRRCIQPVFSNGLGVAGLTLIIAGFFFITEASHFPGYIALIPTLGTVCVIASLSETKTLLERLLTYPFITTIGRLSYSLYLWHWPSIVLAGNYAEIRGYPRHIGALVGLCLGVIFSILAYVTVEQPLRLRGPNLNWRKRLLATGAMSVVMVCGTLMLSSSTNTHAAPVPDAIFDASVTHLLKFATLGRAHTIPPSGAKSGAEAPLGGHSLAFVDFEPWETLNVEAWKRGGIVHKWGSDHPQVLVFGSSHALMYAHLIDDICNEHELTVSFLAAPGHSVFFPTSNGWALTPAEARDFDDARRQALREWSPDVLLVMDILDRFSPETFQQELVAFVKEVEPYTRRIIFFSQIPSITYPNGHNLRDFVCSRLRISGSRPKIFPDQKELIRKSNCELIEAMALKNTKVSCLRVDKMFYMADGSVRYLSQKDLLYFDENHLTEAGAQLVRDVISDAIVDACANEDSLTRMQCSQD